MLKFLKFEEFVTDLCQPKFMIANFDHKLYIYELYNSMIYDGTCHHKLIIKIKLN
jgi:hypothetical protein